MTRHARLTLRERQLIKIALRTFCAGLALNEVDNGYVADSGASPETITEDLRAFFRLVGEVFGLTAERYARTTYTAMVNDIAAEFGKESPRKRAEHFQWKPGDLVFERKRKGDSA
jgi:hypothetical protein